MTRAQRSHYYYWDWWLSKRCQNNYSKIRMILFGCGCIRLHSPAFDPFWIGENFIPFPDMAVTPTPLPLFGCLTHTSKPLTSHTIAKLPLLFIYIFRKFVKSEHVNHLSRGSNVRMHTIIFRFCFHKHHFRIPFVSPGTRRRHLKLYAVSNRYNGNGESYNRLDYIMIRIELIEMIYKENNMVWRWRIVCDVHLAIAQWLSPSCDGWSSRLK